MHVTVHIENTYFLRRQTHTLAENIPYYFILSMLLQVSMGVKNETLLNSPFYNTHSELKLNVINDIFDIVKILIAIPFLPHMSVVAK